MASANWLNVFESSTESYEDAIHRWPASKEASPPGKWILSSHDDQSIIVYQAYNENIAEYACRHNKFIDCPDYNQNRMTWIKTNFLWMMYRSSWGNAPNQSNILAIWLHRSAFDRYLAQSVHSSVKLSSKSDSQTSGKNHSPLIRLQWDPDHQPFGQPVNSRRAIQLGLKNIKTFLSGDDIIRIVDVTSFVREQYQNAVLSKKLNELRVPIERIYEPNDEQVRLHIHLDPAPKV